MALIQEFYHPNIILMPVGAVADGQMLAVDGGMTIGGFEFYS